MRNFLTLTQTSAQVLLAADDATAAAKAKTPKVLTVADDMDSRRIFATPELALPYLQKCMTELSDFANIPFASVGISETGEFDPEVYTDSMDVMVATLRKTKKGTEAAGIKAIVVTPIPKVDALMASEAGKAYVAKIMQKEFNHVAVRALREAEDVTTVADQMPRNIDGFISSGRDSGSGIMEAFNELFKSLNATLGAQVKVWEKARLTKNELKRSLESKGYAEEYYPALENRGEGKPGLFEVCLKLAINVANQKGLDSTIFQRWLDTRNAKAFSAEEAEEDDFDVDSLSTSLLAEPETNETEADALATDA